MIYRKIKGLKFVCPDCGSVMKEFDNCGLDLEARFAGTVPYYCESCEKNKGDYPIFNVTTRKNERIFIGCFAFLIFVIFLILLVRYG